MNAGAPTVEQIKWWDVLDGLMPREDVERALEMRVSAS
jgi:hypothetical protein